MFWYLFSLLFSPLITILSTSLPMFTTTYIFLLVDICIVSSKQVLTCSTQTEYLLKVCLTEIPITLPVLSTDMLPRIKSCLNQSVSQTDYPQEVLFLKPATSGGIVSPTQVFPQNYSLVAYRFYRCETNDQITSNCLIHCHG